MLSCFHAFCTLHIHFPTILGWCGFPTPHFSSGLLHGLGARGEPRLFKLSFAQRFHCVSALSALATLRYYDGSDSCCPSPRAAGLPAYLATLSQRSASNHKGGPYVVFQSPFNAYDVFQTSPSPSQLVANTPPNRVRFTADRQFVSSCSPPHLAVTQLLSTTGPWLTLTRTSTVLT